MKLIHRFQRSLMKRRRQRKSLKLNSSRLILQTTWLKTKNSWFLSMQKPNVWFASILINSTFVASFVKMYFAQNANKCSKTFANVWYAHMDQMDLKEWQQEKVRSSWWCQLSTLRKTNLYWIRSNYFFF